MMANKRVKKGWDLKKGQIELITNISPNADGKWRPAKRPERTHEIMQMYKGKRCPKTGHPCTVGDCKRWPMYPECPGATHEPSKARPGIASRLRRKPVEQGALSPESDDHVAA